MLQKILLINKYMADMRPSVFNSMEHSYLRYIQYIPEPIGSLLYSYEHATCLCLWLYSPCGPWPIIQFLNPYTVGRTPWTGDQPLATYTQNNTNTE
jgi:hypothetical protein